MGARAAPPPSEWVVKANHPLPRRPLLAALSFPALAGRVDANLDDVVMTIESGPVVINQGRDLASGHVARIETQVKRGFYDGFVFHRVFDGFMAQTGDPS
jgi:hypothetical protein